MKIRTGFVSNSSSSSFIINIGQNTEFDFADLLDWGHTRDIDGNSIYNEELINSHLNYEFSKCNISEIKIKLARKRIPYGDKLYNEINYNSNYDEVYTKFKKEIDASINGYTFNENDNYIIGEMDDHHKIEKLIHNYELYFKDEIDPIVISNH